MTDKDFEQIRLKALSNITSRCPPEKKDSIGNKLYEQLLNATSIVCVEMLKEYHKTVEHSAKWR